MKFSMDFRLLSIFCLLLFLGSDVAFAAKRTTAGELSRQRSELKNLEANLAKQRKRVKMLESEEKGVLNTIAVLGENLNRTKEYVQLLSRNESTVRKSIREINAELDSLDAEISRRNAAMKSRIRNLYIHGGTGIWESVYAEFRGEASPERQIYYVDRLLSRDREHVEKLSWLLRERALKKREATGRLSELRGLQRKKAAEEEGLESQIQAQGTVLATVRKSRSLQQRAVEEIERNQKAMLSLIRQLEKKREREIAAAKKAKEKKKAKKSGKSPVKLPPAPVKPIGPKCMPLDGEIISRYGMHEHPVLHIMTRNLGVEIRGRKGAKIRAAAAGTVAMVTEIDGRGPSVIIEHEGGVYSVYGHMSEIRVREGERVKNCQDIGTVGDIASLNGIKLYFQLSEGTNTVDPLKWLKRK